MSTAENKASLQCAIDHWNNQNLDGYLELYDANIILHGFPPGLAPGVEGARQFYTGVWAAFPGNQLTIDDAVAEGDEVAVRFTLRGVHRGAFMGIPPTGKEITLTGITILRFAGGRCVERWNQADFLGLLQQLGAVPAPAQPAG